MTNNTHSRNTAARTERLRQRLEAGFLAARFPEVASIVVNMTYSQRGVAKTLARTLYFFPGSCASFRVDCLNKDCTDGGFDLTHIITGMISSRREASTGELNCEGNGPSGGHSAIVYKVAIQYS